MNETAPSNPAAAGEFVQVDGKIDEQIPAVPFVGYAYGFIFVALLAYVLVVAKGLGKVRAELAELNQRLQRLTGS